MLYLELIYNIILEY